MEKNKALFIQRFVAFIIDLFIITIISTVISIPFVNYEKNNKYSEKISSIQKNMIDNKISINQYLIEYSDVVYKISRDSGIVSLIIITLKICYYVIFQIKNKGQTIGKKIMKIKVISNNKDLFMNQMILRSFISNFILMDIISFMFMLFLPKSIYFYSVLGIESIFYLLTFISGLFIMFRKDGRSIHDILVNTSVVRI